MSLAARRRTCWLLLVAFLYAVLMPSVGLASGKDTVARTVLLQLCNATGHAPIAVELPDASPKAGASQISGGLCLLCLHPATPPAAGVAVAEPAGAGFFLPAVPDAPAPRLAALWRPSLARAPPPAA